LGEAIGRRGWQLVYGGGRAGLMGVVADAALQAGARVVGVIPESLMRLEVGHIGLSELHVVASMHERKQMMAERADAFVALPGGIGTLEELVEQLTWQQLGRHHKPILLANVDGFWEPLLSLLNHMRMTEFIRPTLPINVLMADRVDEILPRLRSAVARTPEAAKDLAPEVARRL
jgi:uncharacterized protein (TIGR00730 family)